MSIRSDPVLRLVRLALAVGCGLAAAPGQAARNVSGGPLQPDQACFDVRHYALRIEVDPSAKAIEGALEMRAVATAPTSRIALDLDPLLTVRSVRLDGRAAQHAHQDGRILVDLPTRLAAGAAFVVEVAYGGQPKVAANPPWDGGFTWAETEDGAPWIATTCQGEGADLWWPCKDHPSDKPDGFELSCTVPEGLVVASNGTLQGAQTEAGRTTYRWRTELPIANYSVALNIAPYVELTDTFRCVDGTEMPVSAFVLPGSVTRAKRCLPMFRDAMQGFEQLLGPYPFRREKYGVAETPHLGMEHQTILAYGNGFGDEQWDWLHNHELAHEWWGNLVTCRDWKDMWLHEGFGTYMQPLYREVRFGRAACHIEVRGQRALDRRPSAPRESRDSKQIYFGGGGGNDIYYKGSLVLHTLRWQLGDERFFTALRRFAYPTEAAARATDGSQVRFVDTDDFVRLCSEIAEQDLGWFFEVYVRRAGLPRLSYRVEDGELRLRWQTPDDLPFHLPVPVQLRGEERRVAMPDGAGALRVDDADFLIDPEQRLLMAKPRRDQERRD